jgi:hypothetical protein
MNDEMDCQRFFSNFVKAGVNQRLAPIDIGLSPFENYWTTFGKTASGLIKTQPLRTWTQSSTQRKKF